MRCETKILGVAAEAHRLRALEQENARLKRIVAELALDISMLKDPVF